MSALEDSMKHQGKQFLAWIFSFGLTGAIFAGGTTWLKKKAHQNSSHQESSEHHDEQANNHGEEHGVKPEEHSSNKNSEHHDVQAIEHHGKADSHGKQLEHKTDEHAPVEHATHDAAKEHEEPLAEPEHVVGKGGPKKEVVHHENKPHWDYMKTSENGPSNWGSLNEQFAQCEKGREQSPIDLKGAITKANAPEIVWHYNPTAVKVENNGHTIVANMPNPQN
jgi:hypothetical protein